MAWNKGKMGLYKAIKSGMIMGWEKGKDCKGFKIELKDFFEFSHAVSSLKELKDIANSLLKEAAEEKLPMSFNYHWQTNNRL